MIQKVSFTKIKPKNHVCFYVKIYMEGYVYCIIINGIVYVGATTRMPNRKKEHVAALAKQRHFNEKLQEAANQYGANKAIFITLKICGIEELWSTEQAKIRELKSRGIPLANSNKRLGKNFGGYTLSEETRCKQSDAKKGERHPDNRKDYAFISPQGEVVRIRGLKEFCKENALSMGEMSRVGNGKLRQHKGWSRFESGEKK